MRVWAGRGSVNTEGVGELLLELRGPDQSDKLIDPNATLKFVGFTRQERIPLFSVWGPELGVYSTDDETKTFFGRLDSVGLAVLFSVNPRSRHRIRGKVIDHLVIYTSEKSVYGRPLVLRVLDQMSNTPSPSPASVPSTPSSQSTPAQEASETLSDGYDWGRLKHKIIKSTMKHHGLSRESPQYKDIYQMCVQTAEMARRKSPDQDIKPSVVQAKLEALLSILD